MKTINDTWILFTYLVTVQIPLKIIIKSTWVRNIKYNHFLTNIDFFR